MQFLLCNTCTNKNIEVLENIYVEENKNSDIFKHTQKCVD